METVLDFKTMVQSMTAKEIIMAMVDGLKNCPITVNMSWYGGYDCQHVCYGCAATATIMKISGVVFTWKNIDTTTERAKAIACEKYFLDNFESAIDSLRSGHVEEYNAVAEQLGIALIRQNEETRILPTLGSQTYLQDLHMYIKLADVQDQKLEENVCYINRF